MKKFLSGAMILISFSFYAQVKELYVSDAANFNVGPRKIIKYDENGDKP